LAQAVLSRPVPDLDTQWVRSSATAAVTTTIITVVAVVTAAAAAAATQRPSPSRRGFRL
jgi:hypothetical protein